ncbi:hypothetical protein G6F35_011095 [Rhizopus arrhizus]|nr:hypothetical protein G6F35_011095 [Rhizopus arrhizus]
MGIRSSPTSPRNVNPPKTLLVKLFNAAKSGRLAGGIAERTAQKWAKRLKEDKDWNILEKQTNKVNRPKAQLDERHKIHLLNFYDNNPRARIVDAVASLTKKFEGFTLKETSVKNFMKDECSLSFKKLTLHPKARNDQSKIADRIAWIEKWSKTDMNHLENCVFVDESGFDINMRLPGGWSAKGTPAITTTPSTRAVSHTVLGAISAKYVVSMELRNPQEHSSKRLKIDHINRKRKAPSKAKKNAPRGTVTGHYIHFIQKTMDEMDCIPEMKGYYIVMDNAPIHTADTIEAMITERGYKCVYLPPYSPELNPIEQFWSIIKNKNN